MNEIDRRSVLRDVLGGALVVTAAVATGGLALSPDEVEAVPLATEMPWASEWATDRAQVVVGPRRRRWGRRRHWVCWWSRGRRVCGWRWV
jgi:hypothetical protein